MLSYLAEAEGGRALVTNLAADSSVEFIDIIKINELTSIVQP